jgi:hypothetical protein
MIASKPENVARQAARATDDIEMFLVPGLVDHRRSVTAAFAWLSPKGTARVAAVISDPGLAFIPFLRSEVADQPAADAADSDKTIDQLAAAVVVIPQMIPVYSRGHDFQAQTRS